MNKASNPKANEWNKTMNKGHAHKNKKDYCRKQSKKLLKDKLRKEF